MEEVDARMWKLRPPSNPCLEMPGNKSPHSTVSKEWPHTVDSNWNRIVTLWSRQIVPEETSPRFQPSSNKQKMVVLPPHYSHDSKMHHKGAPACIECEVLPGTKMYRLTRTILRIRPRPTLRLRPLTRPRYRITRVTRGINLRLPRALGNRRRWKESSCTDSAAPKSSFPPLVKMLLALVSANHRQLQRTIGGEIISHRQPLKLFPHLQTHPLPFLPSSKIIPHQRRISK